MADHATLGQAAAWHLDRELSGRREETGFVDMLKPVEPKIMNLGSSPEAQRRQHLKELARSIDRLVGSDEDLKRKLEKKVRKVQSPPKVILNILGHEDRFSSVEGRFNLHPAFSKSLRVALAMRGGVSLAVWIGGCIAELDILRRLRLFEASDGTIQAYFITGAENLANDNSEKPLRQRAHAYATLLAQCGYDSVEFDILAGASAGGLNSVFYSVAQRAGVAPAKIVLETWISSGGLAALLCPPEWKRVHSLLRGDDYFYRELRKALGLLYIDPERHQDLVANHVTVDLAATIIDSDSSGDPHAEEGRGRFHFEGYRENRLQNHIPSPFEDAAEAHNPGKEASCGQLDLLAYAARTTSSFPGAFEPASIYSAAGGLEPIDNDQRSMRFAFSAHRDPKEAGQSDISFRVVDGGIFDNIPIGRALEAARARVSELPSDRALIYLDPDVPSDPLLGRSRDNRLAHLINAVSASVVRLKRRESVDTEVDDFVKYSNSLWLDKGRSEVLATALSDVWTPSVQEDRRRSYIRYRSTADITLLTRLLSSPAEWQVTSTVTVRRNFRAMTNNDRRGIDTRLIDHDDLVSRQDPASQQFLEIISDPQALLDAAQCALAWLRHVERVQQGPSQAPANLSALRRSINSVIRQAIHHRDVVFLSVLEEKDSGRYRNPQEAVIETWRTGAATEGAELEDDWMTLDQCLRDLCEVSSQLSGSRWTESPWCTLTKAIARGGNTPPFVARDLAPALATAGIPPIVTRVRYWRIGSNEPPGSVDSYDLLLDGHRRHLIQLALNNPQLNSEAVKALVNPVAGLPSHAKLAGSALANFAGFLSEGWRVNDWWWGRMDAASGISGFLESLPLESRPIYPEEDGIPEADHDEEIAPRGSKDRVLWLQNRVLDQEFGLKQPTQKTRREKRQGIDGGAQSLHDLSHSYRVLLLSRGLRVLWRAVLPDKGASPWVASLLHALLSPLLVLIPALAHPAYLSLIVGIAYGSLWILSRPESVTFELQLLHPWFIIPATFLVVSVAVIVVRGRRRWDRIFEQLKDKPDWSKKYQAGRSQATRKALAAGFAAALLLIPLFLAINQARELMVGLCLIFMTALIRLSHVWVTTFPRMVDRRDQLRDFATASSGLFAAVAIPLLTSILNVSVPRDWQSLAVLGAALFILAALLLHTWQKALSWLVVGLLSSTAGTAAAMAVWISTGSMPPHLRASLAVTIASVVWGLTVWWLPDSPWGLKPQSDCVVTKAGPRRGTS